jgi:hypothetical protein
MVRRFPRPGPLVDAAYEELEAAAAENPRPFYGDSELGDLPRPWDPASCTDSQLRRELWDWLDAVVGWHNHEHVWDIHAAIPTCWPHHPHLVHEIAVLADQRLHAGRALTSDLLEDWHRYTLPAFTERLHAHVKDHCTETHQPWPGQGRYTRSEAAASRTDRHHRFAADTATCP